VNGISRTVVTVDGQLLATTSERYYRQLSLILANVVTGDWEQLAKAPEK
jgi:hypothetical protein